MELEGNIQTYHLFNAEETTIDLINKTPEPMMGNVMLLPSVLEPILSVGNEEDNNNTVNLNQILSKSSKSKFENTTGLMLDDL